MLHCRGILSFSRMRLNFSCMLVGRRISQLVGDEKYKSQNHENLNLKRIPLDHHRAKLRGTSEEHKKNSLMINCRQSEFPQPQKKRERSKIRRLSEQQKNLVRPEGQDEEKKYPKTLTNPSIMSACFAPLIRTPFDVWMGVEACVRKFISLPFHCSLET